MGKGGFFQAGFVVPDLDQAMARWHEASDIGPFFVLPDVRPDRWTHHGELSELVMRMVLAQQPGREFAPAIPTTRAGDAAVSTDEVAAEICFRPRLDLKPL